MDKQAWAHLHLPRLKSGTTSDVISLKVPGQKIEYVSAVELSDVRFHVHQGGRQRCIREGVRNVHAWVIGDEARRHAGPGVKYLIDTRAYSKAVYDPWKGGTFVDTETLKPIAVAFSALLIGKDVWYRDYASRYGTCRCGRVWRGDMPDNHSLNVCA